MSSTTETIPTCYRPVQLKHAELSCLLYEVYLQMFSHENVSDPFATLPSAISVMPVLQSIQKKSLPRHHRGSFALLLRFLRANLNVDWEEMMNSLLEKNLSDSTLIVGHSFIQELFVYLYIFGLHTMESFTPSLVNTLPWPRNRQGLRAWVLLPPVVCVTLVVPRNKLKVFTNLPWKELGTPPIMCKLRSSRHIWENAFGAVQSTFGSVNTSGSRESDDFAVSIIKDKRGWKGSAPLVVSFLAPTWNVTEYLNDAFISFGIMTTP